MNTNIMIKNKEEEKLIIKKIGNCTKYYFNNKFHREDGPALEYGDGRKEYYLL